MSELTRCLAQLDNKMDSLIETRLYQLTFEAFMLREESFRMKACDNNTKAMLFCRWQQGDIGPEDVYDQLLVSCCHRHIRAAMLQSVCCSGLLASALQ